MKTEFTPDSIRISVLKLDERLGPQVFISENLPFSSDEFLIKASVFYGKNEGFYGPLPAHGDYQALIYAKSIPDKLQLKMKSIGASHALFVIFLHSRFLQFFQPKQSIERTIVTIIETVNDISEIDIDFLASFKQKVYESLFSLISPSRDNIR